MCVPRKQFGSEFALESLDTTRDSRLMHPQAAGGRVEAPGLGDSQSVLNIVPVADSGTST
jgi:hypothetical protein